MNAQQQLIRDRAGNRCEYCKLSAVLQLATFHFDHVHPVSRGGADDSDNRAFACPSCNLAKSNRLSLIDPESRIEVPIFNPRLHVWSDHFRVDGYILVGLTAIGRALIDALELNSEQYMFVRSVEHQMGLFPP